MTLYEDERGRRGADRRHPVSAIMKIKKRSLAVILAAVLLVAGVAAVFATSRAVKPKKNWAQAEKWVDYYHAEEFPRNTEEHLELEEFPGAVFTWASGGVTAREGDKELILFGGMPVWNVFLCDLTGDGLPEFCATASFGSGMIDEHIMVCDYADAVQNPALETRKEELFLGVFQYFLWDRGEFDYFLSLEEGRLLATRTPYPHRPLDAPREKQTTGALVISGGKLAIEGLAGEEPPAGPVPELRADGICLEIMEGTVTPSGLEMVLHNDSPGRYSQGQNTPFR